MPSQNEHVAASLLDCIWQQLQCDASYVMLVMPLFGVDASFDRNMLVSDVTAL